MKVWVARKICSKLQRQKVVRIVDLFGGVTDYKTRSPYRYSTVSPILKHSPEVIAFAIAKQLERQGFLRVLYKDGRNWLVYTPQDVGLSWLFR